MSDGTNGSGPSIFNERRGPLLCSVCQKEVNATEPHRRMRKALVEGQKSPDDPIVAVAHEVCALRADNAALLAQLQQHQLIICAVALKLGGGFRLHKLDLEKALERKCGFSIEDQPGQFVLVQAAGSVIVPPN